MGFRDARLIFWLPVVLALWGLPALAACRPDQLELRTPSGATLRFSVEVADDPDERARGLMFREAMPTASGMFFVFPEPKQAHFWMKNTPLTLDIIFADVTGTVTRVQQNAVPFSEAFIDGGPGVAHVLEINGGLAGPMGIAPGAVMRHPAIPADQAAWGCNAA